MKAFQVILIVVLAALLASTMLAFVRRRSSRAGLLPWMVVWAIGLAAAIIPDATTRIANMLGIERGKDLLLYCTTLAMLIGFFLLYVRLRRLRRDLTLVVRRLALEDPHENPRREDARD